MESYIEYLGEWLKEELIYRQANHFVFGMSGGVDSAVVAFLLAKFFPEHSLGVMMPSHSHPQDLLDGELVMEACALPSLTVDLTETHRTLLNAIEVSGREYIEHFDEERTRVLYGNMSARLRMTTLYTIAQAKNSIVVGTDNAVEWHTGYFTKFGDGGVDIMPLFHLNKDEVYEMAHLLAVPEKIIQKKPSAGLWEAQTDEEEMGTTYAMLNKVLRGAVVPEKDREVIAFWHERSHHKRALPRTPKAYYQESENRITNKR